MADATGGGQPIILPVFFFPKNFPFVERSQVESLSKRRPSFVCTAQTIWLTAVGLVKGGPILSGWMYMMMLDCVDSVSFLSCPGQHHTLYESGSSESRFSVLDLES